MKCDKFFWKHVFFRWGYNLFYFYYCILHTVCRLTIVKPLFFFQVLYLTFELENNSPFNPRYSGANFPLLSKMCRKFYPLSQAAYSLSPYQGCGNAVFIKAFRLWNFSFVTRCQDCVTPFEDFNFKENLKKCFRLFVCRNRLLFFIQKQYLRKWTLLCYFKNLVVWTG